MSQHRTKSNELAEMRAKLAGSEGKQYWRSLDSGQRKRAQESIG